ncbi:MAG: hypothetical protein QM504_06865 [Pseudomonadota bacterium]
MKNISHTLLDVDDYPIKFLQIFSDGLYLPVTYKKSWDDGFAARG